MVCFINNNYNTHKYIYSNCYIIKNGTCFTCDSNYYYYRIQVFFNIYFRITVATMPIIIEKPLVLTIDTNYYYFYYYYKCFCERKRETRTDY